MKLKGINIFEQHAEKVVAGMVGVSFLGVLAMQFLTEPNRVQVGSGAPLPPDKAYEPVKLAAQNLLAAVETGEPELPEAPSVDVRERLRRQLSGGVAPRASLTAMGPSVLLEESDAQGGTGDTMIAEVSLPAPVIAGAAVHRATIDPLEAVSTENLAALLPTEQPFDKASISVEATFNGSTLRDILGTDPDGDGPQRSVPLGWWRDSVEIVAVELEREELGSDGSWTGATIVPQAPGRLNLLSEIATAVRGPGDMPLVLETARQFSRDVRTPAFYSVIAGPVWAPPTESGGGLDLATQIDRRQKALNNVLKELDRLERLRERANQPPRTTERENTGGGGETRGRQGGGKGSEGERGREGERDRERQATGREPVKTELEKKLEAAEDDRDRLQRELEELNLRISGAAPAGASSGQRDGPVTPLLDDSAVRLWAHDMTVGDGKTYRYRTRVVINNPFFGRQASLKSEQQELAREAVKRGQWSEWSAPVAVDRSDVYFITSAAEGDVLGGPRATAEMYRFYYGYWRRGSTTVEPGDPLVAEARLPADLRIFDLAKLKTTRQPAAAPGYDDRREREGEGEDDVDPRMKENRNRRESAPRQAREEAVAAAELDANSTPALERLRFDVGAVLLDVAPLPASSEQGSAGVRARAFFAGRDGLISVRYPDAETSTELYERVQQSAKAGENQGKPKVKPFEPPAEAPTRRERPAPPPERDGGGGGGGGG